MIIDGSGETHEVVADRLAAAWDVEHNERIDAWNRQQDEAHEVEQAVQQAERERQNEQLRLDEAEAEKERKDAEKKKPKINDFNPDLPPPSVIVPRPSQYALHKLATFEFVEIWYFSPDGCAEATRNHRSQADDAFGLTASNDLLTIHPVASVKASKNARSDHDLTFSEFLQAKNSFLHHAKQTAWPDKHVNVLAEFFWNLENHPMRSNPNGDLIALQYASRIRRQWHDDLKTNPGRAFNIAIINENLMNSIAFEVNASIQSRIIHKVEALVDPQGSPSSCSRPSCHTTRRLVSQRAEPSDRRRSRSPSPRQKFRPSPTYQASGNPPSSQPHLKPFGDRGPHSVCPKCLGRNPHRILECNSPTLWNGAKCHVTRTPEGRLLDPKGVVLCTDWQRPNGCSLAHRSAKHCCLGCIWKKPRYNVAHCSLYSTCRYHSLPPSL
ncbi:hypothetical protein EV363DRAFT_1264033 [Boletus edulis]|nr:hypothetical protein EV363DRAFT_1264033 [Boletus edulis]